MWRSDQWKAKCFESDSSQGKYRSTTKQTQPPIIPYHIQCKPWQCACLLVVVVWLPLLVVVHDPRAVHGSHGLHHWLAHGHLLHAHAHLAHLAHLAHHLLVVHWPQLMWWEVTRRVLQVLCQLFTAVRYDKPPLAQHLHANLNNNDQTLKHPHYSHSWWQRTAWAAAVASWQPAALPAFAAWPVMRNASSV